MQLKLYFRSIQSNKKVDAQVTVQHLAYGQAPPEVHEWYN